MLCSSTAVSSGELCSSAWFGVVESRCLGVLFWCHALNNAALGMSQSTDALGARANGLGHIAILSSRLVSCSSTNVQVQALQSIVNQWAIGPVDQWTSGATGSWTRGLVGLQSNGTGSSWCQTHRGARPNGPVGLAPPSGIHKHVLSMRCGAAPLVQFSTYRASPNSQSRSGICGDTCVPTGARRGLGEYCRNELDACSVALHFHH